MKKYPKVGEAFELTLDFDAPHNQPKRMIMAYGYSPNNWKYVGKMETRRQIRYFILIQKGGTWDEIGKFTGNRLEGQRVNAFKKKFRNPTDHSRVGVHNASWVCCGNTYFPYIHKDGNLCFGRIGQVFSANWYWLVQVK